jgi:membrane dipeptidase
MEQGERPMDVARREWMQGALAAALLPVGSAAGAQGSPAQAVYRRAMVIDALGGLGAFDPADTDDVGLLPRFVSEIRDSGVTAVTATVASVGNEPGKYADAMKIIAWHEREIEKHSNLLIKVRNAADLRAAKASSRVGVIYGFQDTSMLEGDLTRLKEFDNLGVRVVQPVYNRRNLMGDGCLEPNNGGLSLLGRELIGELNRRRILVDMSHAGSRTQAEAIALSRRPCAISHSGCRALNDNPRNTYDREMKALADRGGVMGIYFMPFLRPKGQQTSADIIAHIDHAVKVMGEDHVGIGTDGGIPAVKDLAGYRKMMKEAHEMRTKAGIAAPGESPDVTLFVPEYNHPRRFERLADDLLRRGHSEARVEKILGGNFARLYAEVWG